MAKSVATVDEKSRALAAEAEFTTDSSQELAAGTGAGTSREAADNLIPIITCLQFLSPQLAQEDPSYISGAKPGDIWLRNTPDAGLIDGEQGFIWQRVAFQRAWIEWIDRDAGGGFVARYDDKNDRPDCPGALHSEKNRFNYVNPETDNEITLFHNHIGFVLGIGAPQAYLISYKGAGITESRRWNSMIPTTRDDTHQRADAWDFLWRVGSKFKSNNKGKWYDLVPLRRIPGFAKPAQVALARELAEQFATKKMQPDMGAAASAASRTNDGDGIPY